MQFGESFLKLFELGKSNDSWFGVSGGGLVFEILESEFDNFEIRKIEAAFQEGFPNLITVNSAGQLVSSFERREYFGKEVLPSVYGDFVMFGSDGGTPAIVIESGLIREFDLQSMLEPWRDRKLLNGRTGSTGDLGTFMRVTDGWMLCHFENEFVDETVFFAGRWIDNIILSGRCFAMDTYTELVTSLNSKMFHRWPVEVKNCGNRLAVVSFESTETAVLNLETGEASVWSFDSPLSGFALIGDNVNAFLRSGEVYSLNSGGTKVKTMSLGAGCLADIRSRLLWVGDNLPVQELTF